MFDNSYCFEPTFIFDGIPSITVDVKPPSSGRQKRLSGCPPSVARSQKMGTGILGYLKRKQQFLLLSLFRKEKLVVKKKVLIGIGIVCVLVLAVVSLIVVMRLKEQEANKSVIAKEEAVYLLSQLTEETSVSEGILEIYNPLKNDRGITVKDLETAFSLLQIDWTNRAVFDLDKKKDNYRLTPEEFYLVYDELLLLQPSLGIHRGTYYIFEQQENAWVTNEGNLQPACYEAVEADFTNKIVDLYIKEQSILSYVGESDTGATLHNVWIVGYEDAGVQVFTNGQNYTFSCNVEDEAKKKKETVADIVVANTGVSDIIIKSEVITGKVLGVTKEGIKVEKYGVLPMSSYYRIYKLYGALEEEYTSKLLLGYDKASFVVADGVIEASLLTEKIKATNIRVVLNDSQYTTVLHNIVKLTCDTAFTMTYGEESRDYFAGDEVTLNMDSPWFNFNNPDRVIRFVPKEENGRIQMMSIERSQGFAAYRGTIEVALIGDSLAVINELPIEEYLYGVLPSEMPSYYPMEALKAQAICARGYAYKAVLAGTYAAYGAHLDDSTNSQVYNNGNETEEGIFAVKDTYGMVALCEDKPMNTYFFSTSCGVFSNDGDVWGGEASSYFPDHMGTLKSESVDFSDENAFRNFIKDDSRYEILERDEPYYRWNIVFTTKELSDTINSRLASRIEQTPSMILVQNKSGRFVKSKIETIGTVTDMTVTERGVSGIIKKMVITGTEAVIEVSGQTNVRNLISPKDVVITRQDGSTVENFSSLPSPYYFVEKSGDNFTLYGGGFGHGVGMSQNGAKVLANMDYDAEAIVKYFYKGAELVNIYESIDTKNQ